MSRRWAPGITTAQRAAVTLEEREFVFDTDLNRFFVGDGSTVGGLQLAFKSELDSEVSAAMTPVVQASTVAAGASLLLASGAVFTDSVSFTIGTSGAPNATSPTAGDALANFVAYFDAGSASVDAIVPAVTGISHLAAGSRQIAVGGYFASYNDGSWTPGVSTEAGNVAIFTNALSTKGGSIFGMGIHASASGTTGARLRGGEIDVSAVVSVAEKRGLIMVSPNDDVGAITDSFTISGSGATVPIDVAYEAVAIGSGTGFYNFIQTLKTSGGTQPIKTAGQLWRAGGFTCAYGLDWRDMVFSGGSALFPNNSVIAARNAADSADVPIAKVNTSNNVDLANGALILTPGTPVLATDAEARAQSSTTKALTPANLAARASFSANKAATNQTSIASTTPTKVTFGAEDWDTGSYFDTTNSRWTPPAGKVRLSASVFASTITTSSEQILAIYKNGSVLRQVDTSNGATSFTGLSITILDSANGTDYYEVYVTLTTGSTATINGGVTLTYFQGEQI